MDNLKRDRETIDGMIKRSKEQAGEMSPIASSIPILNSQLKEVIQHLSSIDAIKPEIGQFLFQNHFLDSFIKMPLLNICTY